MAVFLKCVFDLCLKDKTVCINEIHGLVKPCKIIIRMGKSGNNHENLMKKMITGKFKDSDVTIVVSLNVTSN